MRHNAFTLPVIIGLICMLGASATQGDVIVNASEINGDVVFTSIGVNSLNTDAWQIFVDNQTNNAEINPFRLLLLGPETTTDSDHYVQPDNFMGPSNFGPGSTLFTADSGIGDIFGINFFNGNETLYVPDGYLSGSLLSGSATYQNETFASLGMSAGTYTWTWGSGGTADSFTLNVVPEPGSALLLCVGIVGLAATRRRKAIC